jgi:hypothetical protein
MAFPKYIIFKKVPMAKYIDKLEFHNLLKTYKETGSRKSYNEIGKRFLLIAQNYINKPRYINYTDSWKDDLISEAVYDMVRYLHNYDVDRMEELYKTTGKIPDPFSYFSQYCENGMTRYLKERYKDMEVMVKLPFIENMDKREIPYE